MKKNENKIKKRKKYPRKNTVRQCRKNPIFCKTRLRTTEASISTFPFGFTKNLKKEGKKKGAKKKKASERGLGSRKK